MAFYSEKLNGPKAKYSTYNAEFFAIVQVLRHWKHYLVHWEFILFSNHEAVKYINGQHKLSHRHAKWVAFLQEFTFTLRHKVGALNKVADALSRKAQLLGIMKTQVVGFDTLKELYATDPQFSSILQKVLSGSHDDFSITNGFLFWGV